MHERFIIATLIVGACTLFERALPFLFFRNRKVPEVINYLGKVLPMAIMTTLLIFCLRSIEFGSLAGFMPAVLGVLVTIILKLIKCNTLICITIATAVYMVALNIM